MKRPHSLADGRYVLVDRLGVGGMATVFKAYDQRLRVWRAIKVLAPQFANRPSLKERFETEARTMAALQHPNIVKVFDVGRSSGQPFIVMELVEGGNLVEWVKEHGPMPPRMALEVTRQICAGVAVAHSHKIVHRDVKPHNVMVGGDGICRVTDFGIARFEDDTGGLTRTGAVFGTWAYMAPEQRSDAKKVDARADIYSVGATLYFLLTSRTPVDLFAAEKDATVMEDIAEAVVPTLIRATQYSKDERFQLVHEFDAALQLVIAGLPPDPESTPPLVANLDKQGSGPPIGIQNSTLLPELVLPDGVVSETMVPGPGGTLNLAQLAGLGDSLSPDPEDEPGPEGDYEGSGAFVRVSNPATPAPEPEPERPAGLVTLSGRTLGLAFGVVLLLLAALALQLGDRDVEPPPEVVKVAPPVKPPGESVAPVTFPGSSPVDPTRLVEPEVERDAPPVRVEKPPTPPPPPRGVLSVTGEAKEVWLVRDGRRYSPGRVPPGTYKIRAVFDTEAVAAGQTTVREGQSTAVNCVAMFQQCR